MFRRVRLSNIRSSFTVHSAMVYVIQVCRQLSSRTRMELQFHPDPARNLSRIWLLSYMSDFEAKELVIFQFFKSLLVAHNDRSCVFLHTMLSIICIIEFKLAARRKLFGHNFRYNPFVLLGFAAQIGNCLRTFRESLSVLFIGSSSTSDMLSRNFAEQLRRHVM